MVASAQTGIDEGFENDNEDLTPPVGWICEDNGWMCGYMEKDRNRIPHSGDWYAFASYNTDKWMYKEISLTSGVPYRLSFWHITNGVGYFTLEVKYGTQPDAASMTQTIVPSMTVDNEEYQNQSVIFTSSITGTAYVGFHSIADNSPWYLTLDDIIVEETSLLNFDVAAVTPVDTTVYFGDLADYRFRVDNIGAQTETVTFSHVGSTMQDVTFLHNGSAVTSVDVASLQSVEVVARGRMPLSGLSAGQSVEFPIQVSSTVGTVEHQVNLGATALAPVSQFPITEGFEGNDFPPAGWQNLCVSGVYSFNLTDAGSEPVCVPHGGAFMAQYKSFYSHAGGSARLVSPKLSVNETDNIVRFWFYRTDNITNRLDSLNVYFAPASNTVDAQLLGTIHRLITESPLEDVNGWYEYTFNFDTNLDYGFIIFEAQSDYGWNMYLDDITINTTSVDNSAPVVVSLEGTQAYKDTEMELTLTIYDESDVTQTIDATYIINGVSNSVILQSSDSSGKGNYKFVGVLPSQPNHTSGTISFTLTDVLGNSQTSDSYAIAWDWQQPLLLEGFEGEQFPPEGWLEEGAPYTWCYWNRQGTIYYTDSDQMEYVVTPPQGAKQACLEWDFQENVQDEQLTTPLLEIARPTELSFETFAHYGQVWNDSYAVRVLNTNTGSWETVWEAANLDLWVNQYQEPVKIDLNPYIGSNIRVQWRGHNTEGTNLWYSWFIDNVKVIATDTTETGVEFTEAFNVLVYPCPTVGLVTVNSDVPMHQITVYSLGSQVVARFNVADRRTIIDLSRLADGIYFVEVLSTEGRVVRKVVKHS